MNKLILVATLLLASTAMGEVTGEYKIKRFCVNTKNETTPVTEFFVNDSLTMSIGNPNDVLPVVTIKGDIKYAHDPKLKCSYSFTGTYLNDQGRNAIFLDLNSVGSLRNVFCNNGIEGATSLLDGFGIAGNLAYDVINATPNGSSFKLIVPPENSKDLCRTGERLEMVFTSTYF